MLWIQLLTLNHVLASFDESALRQSSLTLDEQPTNYTLKNSTNPSGKVCLS